MKDKILSVATDQFFKFGIRSVTMDELAKEIGISKKTLYQYFEDKDQIVYAVTEAFLNNECMQCNALYKESKNPIDELVKTTVFMREMFTKTNPALLLDLRKYHTPAWELYVNQKDFFKHVIIRNLMEGKEQGYYRNEMNVEIIAQMRIETIEMAFDADKLPSNAFGLLEVQMQVFDHFIHGIVTDKGRQLFKELSINNIN